jgi:hypothetical protein
VTTARWLKTGALVLSMTLAAPLQAEDEAAAPGIHIHAAQSELKNEVYYLSALVTFAFGRQVDEALLEGVPLTFVFDIEIIRERPWMWSERITALEQRYQISYHALTRQYMVRNLNIGTQRNFTTLEAALSMIGTVVDLPLIDGNLLQAKQAYRGRMHVRLDTHTLPAPLRLMALISPEWRLASEWREWVL